MREYKCPSCGAVLSVREEDIMVRCDYCETVINLERNSSEVLSQKASALAGQIRDYKSKKLRLDNLRLNYEQKESRCSQLQAAGKRLPLRIYLTVAVLWGIVCFFVTGLWSSALPPGVIRFLMNAFVFLFTGRFALKLARSQREKKAAAHTEKEEQAAAEKDRAWKSYSGLNDDFNEELIPPEARNEEALDFIIKSLETERAFTLKQAIAQWEDHSLLQDRLREANDTGDTDAARSNAGAETLGAFVGAALGSLGGTIAKEAVKELKRRL